MRRFSEDFQSPAGLPVHAIYDESNRTIIFEPYYYSCRYDEEDAAGKSLGNTKDWCSGHLIEDVASLEEANACLKDVLKKLDLAYDDIRFE